MSRHLTNEQVIQVREDAHRGLCDEFLAVAHKTTLRVIRDCRIGASYQKVDGPITKRNALGYERIPDAEVRLMREKASRSIALKKIAEDHQVSMSYISRVTRGVYRISAGGIISNARHKYFDNVDTQL